MTQPEGKRRPKVVILGGGFGGLYAARALARAPVELTVVDRVNHHLFQPLLYQVATAALEPEHIARPIRRVLRHQKNASVLLADALRIDTRARKVELSEGELSYDYLLVATGSTHSYFGHAGWERVAPGLKTVEDAVEIRRRMLIAYEEADRAADPQTLREWLTFAIVGGGPTGVELAGSLAEISRLILARDFRHLTHAQARVVLIEAGPRLLAGFPPALSARAQAELESLGVEVILGTPVTDVDAGGVRAGEQKVAARTVLWAAGVAASPLAQTLGVPLDRAGRVRVEADLSVPGAPEVFVVGDLAITLMADGRPVPGVAQGAIQGGKLAARNIRHRIAGEPTEPFRFFDKGLLATIGRARAVASIGKLQLSGWLAWLTWVFVHITYLIGFRNRVMVLFDWAWNYFTFDRGARLIVRGAEVPVLPQPSPAVLAEAPSREPAPPPS